MATIYLVCLLSIILVKFVTGFCELIGDFHNLQETGYISRESQKVYYFKCKTGFYSRTKSPIICRYDGWENINTNIPLCQIMKCPVKNDDIMKMFCVADLCLFSVNDQYQIEEEWLRKEKVFSCYLNGLLTIRIKAKKCQKIVSPNENIITDDLCERSHKNRIISKPICRTNRVPGYVYSNFRDTFETSAYICGATPYPQFIKRTEYCDIPIHITQRYHVNLSSCEPLITDKTFQYKDSCNITAFPGYEILDINTSDKVIDTIQTRCVDGKLPVQKHQVRIKVCETNPIEFTAKNKEDIKSYIILESQNLCFFDRNTNTLHYELRCIVKVTGSNSLLKNGATVNSLTLDCTTGNPAPPLKISPYYCKQNLKDNLFDRFYTQSEGCFVDKAKGTLSVEKRCVITAHKGYSIKDANNALHDTLTIRCNGNDQQIRTISDIQPYQCSININALITDNEPGTNYYTDYEITHGKVGNTQTEYFVTANRGFKLTVSGTAKKTVRLFCSSENKLNLASITVERISCSAVSVTAPGLDQISFTNRCETTNNITKECIIRANRGIHFDTQVGGRKQALNKINIINSYCVFSGRQFITSGIVFKKNVCARPAVNRDTVEGKSECKANSDATNIHGECIYYTQRGNYIRAGNRRVSSQVVYCFKPATRNIDALHLNRYECNAPTRLNDASETKYRGNCAVNGKLAVAGFLNECYIFTATGYHLLLDSSAAPAYETIVFCENEGETNIEQVALHPNSCSIAVTNGDNLHIFDEEGLCHFNEAKSVISFSAKCALKTSEGYKMKNLGEVYLARCPDINDQLSIVVVANTCRFPRVIPFRRWGPSSEQNYTALCARRAYGAVIRGCTLKAEPRFYFGDIRHPTNSTQTIDFFCNLAGEPSVKKVFIFPHLCRFPDFFVNNIQVEHKKYAKAQNCEVFGMKQKFFGQCVLEANEDFIFIDEKNVQTNVIQLDCFRHSQIDRKIRIKRNTCIAPPLENGSLDQDCYKLRAGEMCRYQCFNQFAVDSDKSRKIHCLYDENTAKLSFYPKPVCMQVEKEWLMDVLWFVFGLSLFIFLVCSFCLFLFMRRFHNFDRPEN